MKSLSLGCVGSSLTKLLRLMASSMPKPHGIFLKRGKKLPGTTVSSTLYQYPYRTKISLETV
jgi:hypothetical protein